MHKAAAATMQPAILSQCMQLRNSSLAIYVIYMAFQIDLFILHDTAGSPITRIPIMAKQPLDLYRLFKLVVERGGLVEVSVHASVIENNRL